jgi:hypothetical protein
MPKIPDEIFQIESGVLPVASAILASTAGLLEFRSKVLEKALSTAESAGDLKAVERLKTEIADASGRIRATRAEAAILASRRPPQKDEIVVTVAIRGRLGKGSVVRLSDPSGKLVNVTEKISDNANATILIKRSQLAAGTAPVKELTVEVLDAAGKVLTKLEKPFPVTDDNFHPLRLEVAATESDLLKDDSGPKKITLQRGRRTKKRE